MTTYQRIRTKICKISLDCLRAHEVNTEARFYGYLDDVVLKAVSRKVVVNTEDLESEFDIDGENQKILILRYFSDMFQVKIESPIWPFFKEYEGEGWSFSNFNQFIPRNDKLVSPPHILLKALCGIMIGQLALGEISGAYEAEKECKRLLAEIEDNPTKDKFVEFFEYSPACRYDKFSEIELANRIIETTFDNSEASDNES